MQVETKLLETGTSCHHNLLPFKLHTTSVSIVKFLKLVFILLTDTLSTFTCEQHSTAVTQMRTKFAILKSNLNFY